MLKMLKYDLKSVWPVWRILAPVTLVVCAVCGLFIRFIDFESDYAVFMAFYSILSIFMSIGAYFILLAFSMVTAVLLLVRFYKNFFTDEGYLTFTLPVSRTALFNSKVIMVFVWMGATIAVTFLSILLWIVCAFDLSGFWETIINVIKDISYYWDDIPYMLDMLFVIIETFAVGIIGAIGNGMLMILSITVGAVLVNKYKLVLGLGLYFGTNAIVTALLQIISFTVSILFIPTSGTEAFSMASTHIQMVIMLLIYVAMAVGCYIGSLKLIQNKLNLA